jgi:hypothetical protein
MKLALLINHGLMVLVGVSSGLFKVVGSTSSDTWGWASGRSRHLARCKRSLQASPCHHAPGVVGLTACNLFASVGLFVAGVQPVGVISLLFVAMAAVVWKRA